MTLSTGPFAVTYLLVRWSRLPLKETGMRVLRHALRGNPRRLPLDPSACISQYDAPGSHKALRGTAGWFSLEVWFLFFYYYQARKLDAPAKPPPMKQDRMQLARRCLGVTDEIWRGLTRQRDIEALRGASAPGKPLTRARSVNQLAEAVGLPAGSEGEGVEGLLRLWSEGEGRSPRDIDATRKEWAGLATAGEPLAQRQYVAFKRAEVSGWFLGAATSTLRRGNVEEWVAWYR